jgi:signal transduction histidine kinase
MKAPRGDRKDVDSARLVKLQELGRALLGAESTEAVAEASVRMIREIIACSHLSVVVFDQQADQATVMAAFSAGATKGGGGSRWRLDAFGTREELAGLEMRFVPDLLAGRDLPPALAALSREGIRSLLVVPLKVRGEAIGALYAGAVVPGAFGVIDLETLTDAAELLALAVERAKRAERLLGHALKLEERVAELERNQQEHRNFMTQIALAQEQERQRIAVDIHDDSVQVMTTAALRLHTLRSKISDAGLAEMAGELEDTIHLAITRLRHLMFELIPPSLEREGLGAALTLYLDRVKDDRGLAYRVDSRLTAQPPAETRSTLYRIAQEAVTNIIKHARAEAIDVVLQQIDGGYLLRVSDDGVGFSAADVEARLPMHLGLTAMRQRAEMAGGWCRIRSRPGEGTSVEAWVPAAQADASFPDVRATSA